MDKRFRGETIGCRRNLKRKGEFWCMASQPYIGAIFIFAGNFAPTGFELCQGQLLPISQYAALFSILGTTYGGNGSTNFALPDLRGRAPIGEGTGAGLSPIGLGQVGGVQNATILTSNMPAHSHHVNVSSANGAKTSPQNNFIAAEIDSVGGSVSAWNAAASAGATLAAGAVSNAGSGAPLNIQNPYLGINYIIATVGLFPTHT